jgi:dTDP-4-dehydrorhamnose 3,5-epimerase
MNVVTTPLPGVLLLEPKVFADPRGFFLETFNQARYEAAGVGVGLPFVQDNWSRSARGTLRGLHFQEPVPQGKLVWCAKGAVYDVAADVRRGSPTFGRWFGCELTEANKKQLWIPPGFAHGFCVLSESADFVYKCTALYTPAYERAVAWNDETLNIAWPITEPLLSKKDAAAPQLKDAPVLPTYPG